MLRVVVIVSACTAFALSSVTSNSLTAFILAPERYKIPACDPQSLVTVLASDRNGLLTHHGLQPTRQLRVLVPEAVETAAYEVSTLLSKFTQ